MNKISYQILPLLVTSIFSCLQDADFQGFNVSPHFGRIERYACDINNPPKAGEAPCDIDRFRLSAYSERLDVIISSEFSIEEGKSGARFKLPEADDYRIFFQGFNKSKPELMLWCGATDEISLKRGETKDISVFIGRCSDFVFTRNRMASPRVFHTATLLKDGRVLIVGGIGSVSNRSCDTECDGNGCTPYCRVADAISDVEVYDYTTGEFKKVGRLNIPRVLHTATLLDDGRVLIAGGSRSLRVYRVPPDGSPFIYPDGVDDASSSVEIFEPQSNSLKKITSGIPRVMHSTYRSAGGKVYAIGGISDMTGDSDLRILEISPDSGMIDSGAKITSGRILPVIVDFSQLDSTSSIVAVVGGGDIDGGSGVGGSFDIISFSSSHPEVKRHEYSSSEAHILSAFGLDANPIDAGRFLVGGGLFMKDSKITFSGAEIDIYANNPVDYSYFLDVNNDNIGYPEKNRNMLFKRALYRSIYINFKNPKILVAGGFESINPDFLNDLSFIPYLPSNSVEIFFVTTEMYDSIHPSGLVDTVNPVIRMNERRAGHIMVRLPDNSILVSGGFSSGKDISSSAEIFEPYPTTNDLSLLVY